MEFPQEIGHFPVEALDSGSCEHLQTHYAYRLNERKAMLTYVVNTSCKNQFCQTCRLRETHVRAEVELFEKLLLDVANKLAELKAEELKTGKSAKARSVHDDEAEDEEEQ